MPRKRLVEVEGEIQTTCPGIMLHRIVDARGEKQPGWSLTHVRSGQRIARAGTKALGRKAAKILCRAESECGITWDAPVEQILARECMHDLALEANQLGQRGYSGSGTKKKRCRIKWVRRDTRSGKVKYISQQQAVNALGKKRAEDMRSATCSGSQTPVFRKSKNIEIMATTMEKMK
jgi:hypothetical protein